MLNGEYLNVSRKMWKSSIISNFSGRVYYFCGRDQPVGLRRHPQLHHLFLPLQSRAFPGTGLKFILARNVILSLEEEELKLISP